ncbi:MAG: DUF3291 domain-containing protein [Paracoccaceae bacterium]|nr:DUF3291 domain-containing protein [Paracoccaceae bacterium]
MNNAPTYQVAQFNWAILADDIGSPRVAEFVDALDRVDAIAERSDGFVQNLRGERLDRQVAALGDHPLNAARAIWTYSIWQSAKALEHFVHKTVHGAFVKRRAEWFVKQDGPTYVVWPIKPGHTPDINEAIKLLEKLGVNGPTEQAFDFKWLHENGSRMEATHDA